MPTDPPRENNVKTAPWTIGLFALASLGAWVWYEFRPAGMPAEAGSTSDSVESAGTKPALALLGSDPRILESLKWPDVPEAAEYLAGRPVQSSRFLAETADSPRPEVLYLRAALLLALERAPEAAAIFRSLAPALLPPELLYAPWRLLTEISPAEANPYAAPIVEAAKAGRLAPLPAARVLVSQGIFDKALASYLRTDPALWAPVDLEGFRLMLVDESSRNEAGTILLAAFKGGKLSPGMRSAAAGLLLRKGGPPPEEKLRAFLENNPAAASAAAKAVASLLDDRKMFLEEKFCELVEKHRISKPESLIDESVILLTIASAAADKEAFGRWSRELQRRFPQDEVTAWIKSLASQ